MKKISLSLVIFSLFFSCNVFAQQSWMEMMQDHNANLKDVQAAFNQWYATHKPADNNEDDKDKAATKPGEEHEEDGNFMLFHRWEAMMEPRTYPTGVRPDPAVIEKDYQDYLAHQKNNHKALAATPSWTYVGNVNIPSGGEAGRVNRVRFDPNNSSIVYACSPSGGLWKSTNGGTSWSTNTDQLLGIGTSDVAIDPTNSKVMYLATGDGDGIVGAFTTPSTIGVMKSTDGGATWNPTGLHYTLQTSGPSLYTVNELKINPKNTSIVLAATSFGLQYTSNGGVTWNSSQGGNFKSVEFEPGNPKVVYATTASAGYYRSADGGQTFKSVVLPTTSGAGRMQLGVTPAAPNYVYVLADNASTAAFFGLWLSTDTGKTFTLKSTTPNVLGFSNGTGSDATQGQGWYTLSIAVSQTTPTTVLVGGVNIWQSTTSGASWTKLTNWTGFGGNYVHADIHHITYLPGSGTTVYCGDDGGVNKSTNVTSSWTDLSSGLEISEQYSIGLSGSSTNLWISGWQDNGTDLANNGTWSEPMGGDGMMCFIDQTNNNYVYGETYQGGFEMSSSGGSPGSFGGITSCSSCGGNINETGAWVTPWCQDPQSSATIFAGLNNVWKSTNRGGNWAPISTFGTTATLATITVAPSSDQYIYTSTGGSVWATTNGGTNWNNVSGNLPSLAITRIAVDPNNPLRAWVSVSGYNGSDKVYQTSTGGTTWKNISGNLPNLPVNCVVYAGGGIDAMYVGTDMGVYYRDTINTGGHWVSYNTGLPNVIVSDLKIYAPGSILRAATYGRGDWQIPLYQAATSAPIAGFKAYPTKLCAGNTVQFTDTSSNQPTSWKWNFQGGSPDTSSSQNPTITYSNAGTYSVSLTSANSNGNNSATQTAYIVVNPLPATPTITQFDSLLTATPGYPYYLWFKTGVLVSGANTNQLVITSKGLYRVTVADSNGCTNTTLVNITTVSGINELSINDYINAYPNPTTGSLQLVFNIPTDGDYTMNISNVLGQSVYSDKVHLSGQVTRNIDLSGYSKGVYFLTVEGNNTRAVKKILLY